MLTNHISLRSNCAKVFFTILILIFTQRLFPIDTDENIENTCCVLCSVQERMSVLVVTPLNNDKK